MVITFDFFLPARPEVFFMTYRMLPNIIVDAKNSALKTSALVLSIGCP
ncbi:hypothetical protein ABK905_08560 [Acerihabitans sp. KWT182]|uniref:Uncharacterized protein n=1 Tax=Acerihabitans sp. KWT182 TaxID=3157919 RepID=A0AAU7QEF8_9GAMM